MARFFINKSRFTPEELQLYRALVFKGSVDRFDEIMEVRKYNHNHDAIGRFASSPGSSGGRAHHGQPKAPGGRASSSALGHHGGGGSGSKSKGKGKAVNYENKIREHLVSQGVSNSDASKEAFNAIDAIKEGVIEPETVKRSYGLTDADIKSITGTGKEKKPKKPKTSDYESKIRDHLKAQGMSNSDASNEAFDVISAYLDGVIAPEQVRSYGLTDEDMKAIRGK